jgi:uncharacterized protein (DUF433 family)
MTVLEQVQELLPAMTYQEKLRLLQRITQELSDDSPGIERTSGICGGSARIAGTRIPVWTLVEYKKLGANDAELLRAYPTLSAENLINAWHYYRTHAQEIEQEIHENEAV